MSFWVDEETPTRVMLASRGQSQDGVWAEFETSFRLNLSVIARLVLAIQSGKLRTQTLWITRTSLVMTENVSGVGKLP